VTVIERLPKSERSNSMWVVKILVVRESVNTGVKVVKMLDNETQ